MAWDSIDRSYIIGLCDKNYTKQHKRRKRVLNKIHIKKSTHIDPNKRRPDIQARRRAVRHPLLVHRDEPVQALQELPAVERGQARLQRRHVHPLHVQLGPEYPHLAVDAAIGLQPLEQLKRAR